MADGFLICYPKAEEDGDPPRWIACEEPERPPDRGLGYHLRPCAACLIACEANVALDLTSPRILVLVREFQQSGDIWGAHAAATAHG